MRAGAIAQTVQYSYDSVQRLTRVQHADGSAIEYVYDNAGNRLTKTTTVSTTPPNSPPSVVSNPGIANGAVNISTTPVLNWSAASDPDSSDSVAYFVYFGTTSTPPLAYSSWQTNWSPGQLQCFATYYWYVVTRDNHNAQSASPVWSFTTGDIPPLANFAANAASGLAPLTVSFEDQSQESCGAMTSWQWDFNNDGTVDSTTRNPTFTYSAAGDYTVRLTVGDEHGGLGTVVRTNFVSVLGPNMVELVPLDLKIESAGPYGTLVVSYTVTNTGTISLSGKWQWSDWFYLSPSPVLDSDATLMVSFDESRALSAGSVYRRTNMVPVMGIDLADQYLCLNADGADELAEIDTNNNVLAVPADRRLPDLVPGGLSWSGQPIAGQPINVTYSITNSGTLDIRGLAGADVDFYDVFYLSTNATLDATATPIGGAFFSGAMPSETGYIQSASGYLPLWPPGDYWLLLQANEGGLVVESDDSNNTLAVPISVAGSDLVPISLDAPQGAASDARIQIVYAVTNQGSAAAVGFWVDTLYLSTNAVWNDNAYSLADCFQTGPVAAQGSYTVTNSVRLPGWPAGTYYLILNLDSYKILSGAARDNKVLAVPITFQPPAGLPDLVPVSLMGPPSALPGASIQAVYGVTNSGRTSVVGEWIDLLWFSTNAVWDSAATWLGLQDVEGPLPSGSSYFETNIVTVPNVAAGTYYIILQVNTAGLAEEATRTNNDFATTIIVQPPSLLPDLAVVSLLAPRLAEPKQTIQVAYAITNQGGSAASGPWVDTLVLSANATADGTVGLLGFWEVGDAVAAGHGYASTNSIVLPNVAEGDYYLVLTVDFAHDVNESTKNNNGLAVPIALQQSVVPTPTVIILAAAANLSNGAFQFAFTNTPGVNFSVFSTTNLSVPFNRWTLLGGVTEVSPGHFQFTDLQAVGTPARFYRVRWP